MILLFYTKVYLLTTKFEAIFNSSFAIRKVIHLFLFIIDDLIEQKSFLPKKG